VAALAIAGCGDGVDTSDPEAVAEAVVESYTSCGEEGAGVRADLLYPEEEAAEQREELANEETPGQCSPKEPKEYTTARLPNPEPEIPLGIEVSSEDGECGPEVAAMIEVDGRWLVNGDESSPELLYCGARS